MTMRTPVCDGHQGEIASGVDYATIVWPGAPDKHLCAACAHLVWRYLPDLVRHTRATSQALAIAGGRPPSPSVRERAMSLDLVHLRRKQ